MHQPFVKKSSSNPHFPPLGSVQEARIHVTRGLSVAGPGESAETASFDLLGTFVAAPKVVEDSPIIPESSVTVVEVADVERGSMSSIVPISPRFTVGAFDIVDETRELSRMIFVPQQQHHSSVFP